VEAAAVWVLGQAVQVVLVVVVTEVLAGRVLLELLIQAVEVGVVK
jgi:hypothetical protein